MLLTVIDWKGVCQFIFFFIAPIVHYRYRLDLGVDGGGWRKTKSSASKKKWKKYSAIIRFSSFDHSSSIKKIMAYSIPFPPLPCPPPPLPLLFKLFIFIYIGISVNIDYTGRYKNMALSACARTVWDINKDQLMIITDKYWRCWWDCGAVASQTAIAGGPRQYVCLNALIA